MGSVGTGQWGSGHAAGGTRTGGLGLKGRPASPVCLPQVLPLCCSVQCEVVT